MIAETAFNVIQALPEKEYKRLLIMLGVEEKPKVKRARDEDKKYEVELTEKVWKSMLNNKRNRNKKK